MRLECTVIECDRDAYAEFVSHIHRRVASSCDKFVAKSLCTCSSFCSFVWVYFAEYRILCMTSLCVNLQVATREREGGEREREGEKEGGEGEEKEREREIESAHACARERERERTRARTRAHEREHERARQRGGGRERARARKRESERVRHSVRDKEKRWMGRIESMCMGEREMVRGMEGARDKEKYREAVTRNTI